MKNNIDNQMHPLESRFCMLPEYLQAHSWSVGYYTESLFRAAQKCSNTNTNAPLYESFSQMALLAGICHDIGKCGIDERLWLEPSALSEMEQKLMRSHTILGAHIVLGKVMIPGPGHKECKDRWTAMAHGCLYHHERWDGKGYPFGLRGDNIPCLARIISIADAYDAMTVDRPYHNAIPKEEALQELRRGAASQFDPTLVEIFCKIQSELLQHG